MDFKEFFYISKLTCKAFTTKERYGILVLTLFFVFSLFNLIFAGGEKEIFNIDENIYVEGFIGEIGVLNPLFSGLNSVDNDITKLIFQGLSRYDSSTAEVIDNEKIATHTLNVDQKEYTFYINPNAKWHDNEALTADDIIFTYRDVIQNPQFPNIVLQDSFKEVEITKIDQYTVKFTLPTKNSFFFTNTLVGLLPKHIWQDVPIAEIQTSSLNQFPIGNGPYKFDSMIRNNDLSRIQLSRYEEYSDKKSNISKISFVIFPNFEALKKNISMINGVAGLSKSEVDEIYDERFSFYQYILPRYTALFINTDRPILKNKKMRLALQKALDKKQIVNEMGYDFVVDTPLLELQTEQWSFQSNIEEAKGALFDEGWKLNEKTSLRENTNGETLSLRLLTKRYDEGSQQEIMNEKLISLIKDQLKALAVDLQIESYPFNFLQYLILDRDYDLLLYGQSLGYNLDLYSYLHSGQSKGRGLNLSSYRNVRVDQLIEDVRGTFDEETKQEKLKRIGDILANDIPAIYLFTPTYYYIVDKKIDIGDLGKLATPADRFEGICEWEKEN